MNFSTIIIAAIIAAVFIAIVIGAVKNKKEGKKACSCGGDCASCGACHSPK